MTLGFAKANHSQRAESNWHLLACFCDMSWCDRNETTILRARRFRMYSRCSGAIAAVLAGLVLGLPTADAELVGLWRFDGAANPQPDSSSFNNDAEVIEAIWKFDPERGGVMRFEGFGDSNQVQYLEVEDSDSLSIEESGLTIAAWANFATFDTWNSIVAKTGANAQNKPSPFDLYTMNNGAGFLRFYVGQGDGPIAFADSFEAPELGVWQHIAVTLNEDGEVVHYLNGEENGEGFIDLLASPLIDEDMNLFIGSRLDGTTNMDGLLDDVALFRQALTPSQIQAIMGGDFSEFIGEGMPGDFNGNGFLDAADIDQLSASIRGATTDLSFDLTADGAVDGLDRQHWIVTLKNTWVGDSNLDGEFNSSDFVQVFQRGEYEDATSGNSTWEDGDWNGDGDFNSGDFVTAFQGGGFEVGPRAAAAVAAVPEPSTITLLLLAIPIAARIRRRA
jgi:hypothetical protein